jgi:hypothetical protein
MCGGGSGGGVFSGGKAKSNPHWQGNSWSPTQHWTPGQGAGSYSYGRSGGNHGWTGQDGQWQNAEWHKNNRNNPAPTPGVAPTSTPISTPIPTPAPVINNPGYWADPTTLSFADQGTYDSYLQRYNNYMASIGQGPAGSGVAATSVFQPGTGLLSGA